LGEKKKHNRLQEQIGPFAREELTHTAEARRTEEEPNRARENHCRPGSFCCIMACYIALYYSRSGCFVLRNLQKGFIAGFEGYLFETKS
jgi:hypothetical protein